VLVYKTWDITSNLCDILVFFIELSYSNLEPKSQVKNVCLAGLFTHFTNDKIHITKYINNIFPFPSVYFLSAAYSVQHIALTTRSASDVRAPLDRSENGH